MRVLHLITSVDPSTGGPANVIARMSPEQASRGHEVRVVSMDTPEVVEGVRERFEGGGVRLFHAPGPVGRAGRARAAAEVIERATEGWAPGVGHIHGMWQAVPHVGAKTLRSRGVPYVFRPCGMLDPTVIRMSGTLKKRAFLLVRGKKDLDGAGGLHFTTTTERDLVAPMGIRAAPFVVPNGIEWGEFETLPARGGFRSARGLGERPLVTFFSRLHEKKGLDLLLPAFAEGAPEDAALALVGPGDPAYVEGLKGEAARLGIADRVLFTGMLRGADRFAPLVDADLFCLPSYQENFGVAVVEALACGAPALISDQVNIFQDVVDAGVGRATACDAGAVASAMGAMLADRAALREMGVAGRVWARETFPWSRIVDAIDAMYARVTGNG